VGLAVRCWYFYKDYNFVYNHFTTQACVDCFGMGALIAYYHTEHPEKLKKIVLNKWIFMGIVLVYICSTLGYFNDGKDIFNNLYRTTERTLVSILCVWFIGWGIYYPSKLLHTLSTHPFIIYCSKISYGIYVYHFLVSSVILQILHKFDATISNYAWWVIVLKFVFTISVSAVSYKFIEAPILLLKKRYFTDNIQEKTIAMPMVFYLN
jgi:peptidoglycan/LPS O-acetylase OafA/YrhL